MSLGVVIMPVLFSGLAGLLHLNGLLSLASLVVLFVFNLHVCLGHMYIYQGRGVHVTGVSAAYTFKLNKNILSE
jgi:hypothetical protein